jgi:hypothetical protein
VSDESHDARREAEQLERARRRVVDEPTDPRAHAEYAAALLASIGQPVADVPGEPETTWDHAARTNVATAHALTSVALAMSAEPEPMLAGDDDR